MTLHEIFSRMTAEQSAAIFNWLHDKERKLHKATIEALAKQRHLRGIFVERKPRPERNTWLQEALRRKTSDGVAAQILQIWLVGEHSKLLCDFLDSLGIHHDENGTLEELPAEPSAEKLRQAIDSIFEKHEPGVTAIYLQAFHAMNESEWKTLGELLETDSRLQLGKPV